VTARITRKKPAWLAVALEPAGFRLPASAVTEAIALIGVRRGGKSNAAAVMAEEMYDAALPWVGIDPKGDWWGLRSSADGTGPGLAVPVFGGLHGDLPLVPEAGRLIAELVVSRNLTCILDVSRFSKAGRVRFLADFAERLYELHQEAPQVRMLFLEEADKYCPQRVMADMARCVGAFSDLVRLGGSFGLGITLISQRCALINKDVLSEVEAMIPLRTTGPQDRKAIRDWMEHHALAGELVDSLPGLENGEAWISSSHWLPAHGMPALQKIRFRPRRTFDSGATPKPGEAPRRPSGIADIDLAAVSKQMAAVVEQAAASDPAALRRQVRSLEQRLARGGDGSELARLTGENQDLRTRLEAALARPPERVEVPVVPPGDVAAFDQAVAAMRETADRIELSLRAAPRSAPARAPALVPAPAPAPVRARTPAPVPVPPPADPDGTPGTLTKAERAILTVLAQFPGGRTKIQTAILSGYSVKSSTFANAMSALRVAGLITRGTPAQATHEGTAALGAAWEPLPSGSALISYWMARLGRSERAILQALLDASPGTLDKAAIAEATSYSVTSSTFANALSRLRTLELISGYGEMRADETLAEHAGQVT
jgi:hypothetical protein